MLTVVKTIAIFIMGIGSIVLLSPKTMKALMAFFGAGKRLYIAGIFRILFSIVLLFSSSQCKLVWVVLAVGILMLIGGMGIFALGLEKLKSILKWFHEKPLPIIRFLGLLTLCIGVLLLYSA